MKNTRTFTLPDWTTDDVANFNTSENGSGSACRCVAAVDLEAGERMTVRLSSAVAIIGGGAAGMFAAAVCAETDPACTVVVLEQGERPLAKVRISGGGRCNLTHECDDIRHFCENYPRGGSALIGPFHRFGSAATQAWFAHRGVTFLVESDGRVFPRSGGSEAVIRALRDVAGSGRVMVLTGCRALSVQPTGKGFGIALADGRSVEANALLVAAGGGAWIEGLDHTIEPWVPSLFGMRTADAALHALAGLTVSSVRLTCRNRCVAGALLFTHQGVSGPSVLTCSAILARELAAVAYRTILHVNWVPEFDPDAVRRQLRSFRTRSSRARVQGDAQFSLPVRLWRLVCDRADIPTSLRWGEASEKRLESLFGQIFNFELHTVGRVANRPEFVTCGGVRLSEIDFRTMASRRIPGLFLAGEVLDIDGLTGGFNLQAAWTTGWLAAHGILRHVAT